MHHRNFTLDRRHMPDLAILARRIHIPDAVDGDFDGAADPLRHRHPRNMEKQAEADAEQQKQQQGSAGEAERGLRRPADHVAQYPARRQRQLRLQRVHAQKFDADAAEHHQYKADSAYPDFVPVNRCGFLLQ